MSSGPLLLMLFPLLGVLKLPLRYDIFCGHVFCMANIGPFRTLHFTTPWISYTLEGIIPLDRDWIEGTRTASQKHDEIPILHNE